MAQLRCPSHGFLPETPDSLLHSGARGVGRQSSRPLRADSPVSRRGSRRWACELFSIQPHQLKFPKGPTFSSTFGDLGRVDSRSTNRVSGRGRTYALEV